MYPTTTLTILTPIVFFVLLVSFPVIGLFAGWKRAAYWGGGNLLVYIIGLIIWKTCGWNISMGFTNMLFSILGDVIKSLDFHTLLNSVITPLFFVIVMLAGNIILVICYYTFAKRLIGIGKYDKNSKKYKEKHKDEVVAGQAQVQTKTHVANTKWFNRSVGAVGLTVLMLPITLTTTHLTVMTTTSTSTRQTNSFAKGMYDGLQSLSNGMSWFSFYKGDATGRDFDGLFSAIALYYNSITYKNTKGEDQVNNPLAAISATLNEGLNNLINLTLDEKINILTQEAAQPIVTALNNVINSWNSVIEVCVPDLEVAFDSPGIVQILSTLIGMGAGKIKINDKSFEACYLAANGIFNILKDAYVNTRLITLDGKESPINHIEINIGVTQDTFNILVDAIYGLYDVTNLSPQNQAKLEEYTVTQLLLFFYIQR